VLVESVSRALPDVPVAWGRAGAVVVGRATVVFQAVVVRAVPVPPGCARRGEEGGETSGEPWGPWGAVPPWFPPPGMSRPQAVRCRGGWSGVSVVGTQKG
jgi:hypothetical protein